MTTSQDSPLIVGLNLRHTVTLNLPRTLPLLIDLPQEYLDGGDDPTQGLGHSDDNVAIPRHCVSVLSMARN